MTLCRQSTGNCFVNLRVFSQLCLNIGKQTFTEFVDILRHNWSRKNWKTPLSIHYQCNVLSFTRFAKASLEACQSPKISWWVTSMFWCHWQKDRRWVTGRCGCYFMRAVDILSHSDVWSSWSRSRVAASAAASPLSHAGGVQAGSSPCLCWRQLWLHHLVHDTRPTGHLWCRLFGALYFCSTSLCNWYKCLLAWLQLAGWGSRYGCTICSMTLKPSSNWSLLVRTKLGWSSDTSIGCRWHKKVSSCSHHLVNTAQHSW